MTAEVSLTSAKSKGLAGTDHSDEKGDLSQQVKALHLPASPFAAFSGAKASLSTDSAAAADREDVRYRADTSSTSCPTEQSKSRISEHPILIASSHRSHSGSSSASTVNQPTPRLQSEQQASFAVKATADKEPPAHLPCPVPADDAERLKTVHCLQVLDSPEDPVLTSLCNLLCSILKVPLAGISIVDDERLWFKALVGLPRFEHPRHMSFCGWTLLTQEPEVLVVENAREDRRFSASPFVVNPQQGMLPVIFWAGCPLVTSTGHRLGSICVIDYKPRKLQDEHYKVLTNFAEMAVRQLEKDHHIELQKQANKNLLRTLDCFSQGLLLLDLAASSDFRILYANEPWSALTGVSNEELVQKPLLASCQLQGETHEGFASRVGKHVQQGTRFSALFTLGGSQLQLQFRPAGRDDLGEGVPQIGIPSYIEAAMEHSSLYFAIAAHERDGLALDDDDSVLAPSEAGNLPPGSTLSSGSSTHHQHPGDEGERLQGEKMMIVRPGGSIRAAFAEVELGVLVRASQQGRIFRGRWKDDPAAVKVMEMRQSECQQVGTSGVYAPAEAILSARLDHPHIVRAYRYAVAMHSAPATPQGAGRPWVECWLVREWCGRGTLTDALLQGQLQRKGTRSVDHTAVLATAAEIAGAMQCLHEQGVVHGNLTGDCVWLAHADTQRGFVAKVADFSAQQPSTHVPDSHPAKQRLTHCPPELLLEGRLSKATDVYMLGMLIYAMSTQQQAWSGLNLAQIRAAIADMTSSQRAFPADVLLQIQNIANLCMASNPEERPTAAVVQRFLHDLLHEHLPPSQTKQAADESAVTQPAADAPAKVPGCNPFACLWHARSKKPV